MHRALRQSLRRHREQARVLPIDCGLLETLWQRHAVLRWCDANTLLPNLGGKSLNVLLAQQECLRVS